MEKYWLSVKAGTHFEEPGAHLELDSVVCLGLHVDKKTKTAPLAKLAQGESGVLANLVRSAWLQFLPTPARSMLRAFHQAVCLPLLTFQ
jgi:hypothetical protein